MNEQMPIVMIKKIRVRMRDSQGPGAQDGTERSGRAGVRQEAEQPLQSSTRACCRGEVCLMRRRCQAFGRSTFWGISREGGRAAAGEHGRRCVTKAERSMGCCGGRAVGQGRE